MRFLADGPSLPDELLVASDEGRVLFFCGAGVSCAKANLPNFLDLARRVMLELRVLPESPAQQLLNTAATLAAIDGVGGIIAADRIFGLLEREFAVADIERAVGAALKPDEGVDLSAHRTLLALSRSAAGKVQLVTTNFDRLFEAAAPNVPIWTPRRLPDFKASNGFDGIVHLHGVFDPAYDKPVDGHFVLSSAEFGRAYLAEAWATDFFRSAIQNYLIVFVGYAADDPPVQYLLEALNRVSGVHPNGLYAFQSGREDTAKALWAQKGVRAIAYAPDDDHAALWITLEAWADRARSPERWRNRLIRRAGKGPKILLPYERGQIVHLAATEIGAIAIAKAKPPLPANWLCTFDPSVRYGRAGPVRPFMSDSPHVDPFADYGLDSDAPLLPDGKGQPDPRAEIPKDAIDVLKPNSFDRPTLRGRLCGPEVWHSSELPPRLASLAIWLGRICDDPAAVWWASAKGGMHPAVIRQITSALDREIDTPVMRSAWRHLLEAWSIGSEPDYARAHALEMSVNNDGWTVPNIRQYAAIFRPSLKVFRPWMAGPVPPSKSGKEQLRDLVALNVSYPAYQIRFEILDDHLPRVISLLRSNLEYAVDLESEISQSGLTGIVSIEPDPNLSGTAHGRSHGVNAHVLSFVEFFRRLVGYDKIAALHEFAAWRHGDDPIFSRLRLWAAGLDHFLADDAAGEVLVTLDDGTFWGMRSQRDLLLSMCRRWQGLEPEVRVVIEKRLLTGPPPVSRATIADNRRWRAFAILDRVTWLCDRGCTFATPIDPAMARLRKMAPQWTPKNAAHAADSTESRSGFVSSDTSFDGLAELPISELIPRALQQQQRSWGEMRISNPFAGLSEKRPIRMIAALRCEQGKGTDVVPLWSIFLNSGTRRTEPTKRAALIGRRLALLPQPVLNGIILPASSWLEGVCRQLYQCDRDALLALFDRLVATVARSSSIEDLAKSALSEGCDWANQSVNSVEGLLAETLFGDPELNHHGQNYLLPETWRVRAERLLTLPNDQGRFSLTVFARHLDWLHKCSNLWAEKFVIQRINSDKVDRDAALAGFLLNAQVGSEKLYGFLKKFLIGLSNVEQRQRSGGRYDTQVFGGFFVTGWLSRNSDGMRWFSDAEFRRVLIFADDDLRGDVLWHVGRFDDFTEKLALLRDVWPRQLSVRTPVVVGRLCAMAFDDEPHFVELIGAILPLISHADGENFTWAILDSKADGIARNYPDQVLQLLDAVLPDAATRWPYGAGPTLERLVQTKPALAADPRMFRLKGIWDRR